MRSPRDIHKLKIAASNLVDELIKAESAHYALFKIGAPTKYGPEIDSIQTTLSRLMKKAINLQDTIGAEAFRQYANEAYEKGKEQGREFVRREKEERIRPGRGDFLGDE